MQKDLENLINLLASKSINYYDFITKAKHINEINSLIEVKSFTMWQTLGLPIIKLDNGKVTLKTRETSIDEAIFCVVDIETSGGIKDGQIIEIGAVKFQNGKILDKFQSFAKAKSIPENIVELTGITLDDLKDAPALSSVIEKFKIFLSDSVFVAHNAKFDYNFISITSKNLGLGPLLNRAICTINLARRTISAEKYGLSSLKELLGINNAHHRALNDAISACEILKVCLKNLPWNVQSVEDLIEFSKNAKTVKIITPKG
ncbi:3'-5' exonuclease [Campylobacter corcagiensis]|uniref:3'-5' exonuclease n=1 Tax=Campylobacter corcagiensis TaxID=1448857 RepID=A0A7M1LEV8_9BACT|nr:3'-5' exonuclease [Campylobacter corcagiensis]QKF64980.1 DNA polymerase III, epsilon subunit [Campylobacter corcagiensis]QOQ86863.1 3'-5' exonuclease [Campylobacter corcagiensis]